MNRFPSKCFLVFLIFVVVLVFPESASAYSIENSLMNNSPNQNQEKYSPLLLHTQMKGRRMSEKLADKNKLSEYLLEALEEYPWTTVIAVNNDAGLEKRGNTHNFTPRLGRTLDADDVANIINKNTAFSPQLGKTAHYNSYSTRLGKEDLENYIPLK